MKKNAAIIAGILFVTGCASSQGQRASYSSSGSPTQHDRSDVTIGSTEQVERNSHQSAIAPVDIDTSTAVSQSYADSHLSADSSKRGGSLDARAFDPNVSSEDLERTPNPINPGKQADSSIRGGSITARNHDLNHDGEASTSTSSKDLHLKADSSIRGGSLEARGGREAAASSESDSHSSSISGNSSFDGAAHAQAARDSEASDYSSFDGSAHIQTARENDVPESRDDFGQGSSATWESDKAQGSVRGSANWNSSDDLLKDGTRTGDGQSTASYEFNNDASVGGAARSETGSGSSSLDDEELNSQERASQLQGNQDDSGSQIEIQSDLNSSEQLESNISGDLDLGQNADAEDSSSLRTTDPHHNDADLNSPNLSVDADASGAAASSEVGAASSSDSSNFESNDPAMAKPGSPLGTAGGEPNFLYEDNRAHGVGSATSGDFATAPVNVDAGIQSDDSDLTQRVKGTLTRESTGTHGLMRHEVARNVQVTAKDGEVTLTGTVPSQKDKDLIEVRAREISGVKSVRNELSVTAEADAAHRDIIRGSDLEDVTSDLQR